MSHRGRWAGWVAIVAVFVWSAVATEVSIGRMVEGLPFMWDFLRRMVPAGPIGAGQRHPGRDPDDPDRDRRHGGRRGAGPAHRLRGGPQRGAALALLHRAATAQRVPRGGYARVRALLRGRGRARTVPGQGFSPGDPCARHRPGRRYTRKRIEAIDSPRRSRQCGPPGPPRSRCYAGACFPSSVPQFLSFTLYRFETNIRAAAILGFVGAGGIGFYVQTYLRMLNYPAVLNRLGRRG